MKRRELLAGGALAMLGPGAPAQSARLLRRIPASGESISAVGMGTWLTFDVGTALVERNQRKQVLERFFTAGGGMIDSSPMYGRAEKVLGDLLPELHPGERLFSATKVWTAFDRVGPTQMAESMRLWGERSENGELHFDLMQVHNLLNWRDHLKTLRAGKEQGRFRYIGVTTSHGRRHDEVLSILAREPIDFLQITLNLADRSALPVIERAAGRGVAVIVNRPFDGGLLFNTTGRQALPSVARDLGCANWAQVFLAWLLSYPQVTCAIPATTRADHMDENMGALRLPVASVRQRDAIAAAFERL